MADAGPAPVFAANQHPFGICMTISGLHSAAQPTEVICHECGLAHKHGRLEPGEVARCVRCGNTLYRHRPPGIDRALALTLAGVVLFIVANSYPFLSFQMGGTVLETTLATGSLELYEQGKWELAVIVALTSIIAPGLQLASLLYVLIPIHFGRIPYDLARVFRVVDRLVPWSMMDVFMLGILVSVVKLAAMATIIPGPALGAFTFLIFVLAGAQSSLDAERIWSLIPVNLRSISDAPPSELFPCPTCHLTVAAVSAQRGYPRCPRCASALHHRKPESLQRTWALLLASCVCYLPANLLPIMHTTSLGQTHSDTIMSGVLYLLHHGDWPLALVVFVASVLVPFLKILILTVLLISVQLGTTWRRSDRTRLYRMTEAVGRWSMVDIYVVTILVALVQLGNLATVEAGWGAVFFAAVVILTMFAAMSFDPRLIWDAGNKQRNKHVVQPAT